MPWILALVLGCSLITGRGDLAQDLQRLCEVATEIEKDTSIDVSQRLNQLAKRMAAKRVGPAGVAFVKAIQKTPPAMRRKILDELLEQNGVEDFRCPALRGVLTGK